MFNYWQRFLVTRHPNLNFKLYRQNNILSKVIITPKGKVIWSRLAEPDTKFDSDGLYTCKLHVSEEDFKNFEQEIEPVVKRAYEIECQQQGKTKLRMANVTPVRITEDGDYEIYAKQKAKVTTRSKGVLEFAITAVDSSGKKIAMPQVGNGSELKMAVEVHPWYVASQGFGYSLRLRAVQIGNESDSKFSAWELLGEEEAKHLHHLAWKQHCDDYEENLTIYFNSLIRYSIVLRLL